jgi:hypothetical protein
MIFFRTRRRASGEPAASMRRRRNCGKGSRDRKGAPRRAARGPDPLPVRARQARGAHRPAHRRRVAAPCRARAAAAPRRPAGLPPPERPAAADTRRAERRRPQPAGVALRGQGRPWRPDAQRRRVGSRGRRDHAPHRPPPTGRKTTRSAGSPSGTPTTTFTSSPPWPARTAGGLAFRTTTTGCARRALPPRAVSACGAPPQVTAPPPPAGPGRGREDPPPRLAGGSSRHPQARGQHRRRSRGGRAGVLHSPPAGWCAGPHALHHPQPRRGHRVLRGPVP